MCVTFLLVYLQIEPWYRPHFLALSLQKWSYPLCSGNISLWKECTFLWPSYNMAVRGASPMFIQGSRRRYSSSFQSYHVPSSKRGRWNEGFWAGQGFQASGFGRSKLYKRRPPHQSSSPIKWDDSPTAVLILFLAFLRQHHDHHQREKAIIPLKTFSVWELFIYKVMVNRSTSFGPLPSSLSSLFFSLSREYPSCLLEGTW